MKKAVVLQSNYIPWKGYFDLIHDADLFVFYDEVQYTKNDWRNRNRIYSKNGLQWLTIPIAKEAVKQKISEVLLPGSAWREKHYKSIYFAYKNAPHFGQLEPLLKDVFLSKKWEKLVDLNRYLITTISRLLGIETLFKDSKDFELKGDKVERLMGLLKQAGAEDYISGPSARAYLSAHENLFKENRMRLTYKDYSGYPAYRQLRLPFRHEVSIVDMIANLPAGEIKDYIWGKKTVPCLG